MNLQDIIVLLGGELLIPGPCPEIPCLKVFASDLMSDVLAFLEPGSLLLTGLVNHHTIRTATLADVAAVVFVQGKTPDGQVIAEAQKYNLPLVRTGLSMFEACSRLGRHFPAR